MVQSAQIIYTPHVVDGHDARMVPQATHGLGLAADACPGLLVQTLALDEGEGHVPVQACIVGQVDPLLAAFTQEAHHLIAASREGGWEGGKSGGLCGANRRRLRESRSGSSFCERLLSNLEIRSGVGIRFVEE